MEDSFPWNEFGGASEKLQVSRMSDIQDTPFYFLGGLSAEHVFSFSFRRTKIQSVVLVVEEEMRRYPPDN